MAGEQNNNLWWLSIKRVGKLQMEKKNILILDCQEIIDKYSKRSYLSQEDCNNIIQLLFQRLEKESQVDFNIENKAIEIMLALIGDFSDLKYLDLSQIDVFEIPDSFLNLKKLKCLNLSDTKILSFPISITQIHSLKRLYLTNTEISELPESIGELVNISYLDIAGTGICELPQSFKKLKRLKYFNMNNTPTVEMPYNLFFAKGLKELHLAYTEIDTIPDYITKLNRLRVLDIKGTNIAVIPEQLAKLTNLKKLDLCFSQVSKLPHNFGLLTNLEVLDAREGSIGSLPNSIGNCQSLKQLILGYTFISELPHSIGKLKNLRELILHETPLKIVPKEIGYLDNLEILDFDSTELKVLPDSITNLNKLHTLYLGSTEIVDFPHIKGGLQRLRCLNLNTFSLMHLPDDFGDLVMLENLSLCNTQIEHLPESIDNIKTLKSMSLEGTAITFLPDCIKNLSNLEELELSETRLMELPNDIGLLKNLKRLSLGFTKISELPDSMSKIENLEVLDLSHCTLKELPEFLLKWNLPFINRDVDDSEEIKNLSADAYIDITGVSLVTQPVSLYSMPRELIVDYYKEAKIDINTTKCIVLGYGGAGKTYSIARVVNHGRQISTDTIKTNGIDIKHFSANTGDGRKININFWDFGGQQIMYSMHRCFLTERTCYLVVVDTRHFESSLLTQVRYWLQNISVFAPGSQVMIMVNLWDNDSYRGLDTESLYNEFGEKLSIHPDIIITSVKMSTQEQFNKEVTSKILQMAKNMASVGMKFPDKWNNILSNLNELGKNHRRFYISEKEYRDICYKYNVKDRNIQKWLIDWFNDLGVCFSYDSYALQNAFFKEYKVLDPKWVINAIYLLIMKGYEYIDPDFDPGILRKRDITDILGHSCNGTVNYIDHYEDEECDYIIGLMRAFKLSYRKTDSMEFIPALLPDRRPDKVNEINICESLLYELDYSFLPKSVIHRLMIQVYDHITNKNSMWSKGFEIDLKEISQQIIVEMVPSKDIISITVISSKETNLYLGLDYILKEIISINADFSLVPTHYILIPDENEKVSVDRLRCLQGRKALTYQGVHKDYNINKLLGNTYGSEAGGKLSPTNGIKDLADGNDRIETELRQIFKELSIPLSFEKEEKAVSENSLIEDLTGTLCRLQKNRKYSAIDKEDAFNDYVRDMLENAKYEIKDQARTGNSSNKKEAGELDLQICEHGCPVILLEGIRLDSLRQKDLEAHILKLLVNYDPNGCKSHILLIYATMRRLDFFCSKLKRYLQDFNYPYNTKCNLFETETDYTDIKHFSITLERNERNIRFHCFVVGIHSYSI